MNTVSKQMSKREMVAFKKWAYRWDSVLAAMPAGKREGAVKGWLVVYRTRR